MIKDRGVKWGVMWVKDRGVKWGVMWGVMWVKDRGVKWGVRGIWVISVEFISGVMRLKKI